MTRALPSGFYDLLVTERTLKALQAQAAGTSQTRALDAADSVRLAETLHRQLASVLQEMSHRTSVAAQLALVNGLLADLRRRLAPDFPGPAQALELVAEPPSVLTSVLHHGAQWVFRSIF